MLGHIKNRKKKKKGKKKYVEDKKQNPVAHVSKSSILWFRKEFENFDFTLSFSDMSSQVDWHCTF